MRRILPKEAKYHCHVASDNGSKWANDNSSYLKRKHKRLKKLELVDNKVLWEDPTLQLTVLGEIKDKPLRITEIAPHRGL